MEAMATHAKLDVETLKPRIGSIVHLSREDLVSGAYATELRALLDDRIVLCFPRTDLTADEQIAFTRTLGTRNEDLSKDIWKVATDKALNPNPKLAEYQRSSVLWHIDGIYTRVPDLATTLCAQALSSGEGGQTQVANMYAAYEDLPEDRKAQFETLRIVHSFATHMAKVITNAAPGELADWQRQGSVSRRLVWTHASGRKSLVLGAHALRIEGMAEDESRALLDWLHAWATQDKYVYSHEWALGDVIMFANNGALHRAVAYPLESGRLMHRTSLRGEEEID